MSLFLLSEVLFRSYREKNHQIFDQPLLPPFMSDQFYFSIFVLSRWNSLSVQNLRSGTPHVQILVIKDRVLRIDEQKTGWWYEML